MTCRPSVRNMFLSVSISLLGFVGTPRLAFGQANPLPSGSTIPGTSWQVQYAGPISLSFDASQNGFSTKGTLIETTTRNNIDPLTISFQQVFETSTSSVSGGLRLLFKETVTNQSTKDWAGYTMQLIDNTPAPNNPPSDSHPPEPHFHPNDSGATFPPFNPVNLPDPATTLNIGDGINKVAIGGDFNVTSLLLHERQFAIGIIPDPGRRTFDLVETPIPTPEPGGVALVATLVLVGSVSLRNRRRKTV